MLRRRREGRLVVFGGWRRRGVGVRAVKLLLWLRRGLVGFAARRLVRGGCGVGGGCHRGRGICPRETSMRSLKRSL